MTCVEAMKLFNIVSLGEPEYAYVGPMTRDGTLIDQVAYESARLLLGESLGSSGTRQMDEAKLERLDVGTRLPSLVTELKCMGLGGLSYRRLFNKERGHVAVAYVVTDAELNGLVLIGRATAFEPPSWGPYTRLCSGIVVTAALHQKAVAHVTALDVLSEQPSKSRRKAKYDWPLVVQMAVHEVADKHHDEEPLPTAAELSASVAERYLDETGHDLHDRRSDIRKYCAAVLKGLQD